MTEPVPSRRYRFGVFEADAALGELRKHGIRIKLNAQPFQVLTMLLEHPGELLTREQISRELWPDGTFVDYEHGVNAAVNRLREALGDTARNPRFVETLARRGYRFVAPVERIGMQSADEPAAEPAPAALEPSILDGLLAAPEDLARAPHRVVRTLFVLLQLMYVAFYVGALANLAEIEELLSVLSFAAQAFVVLIATAAVLIPVRAFLLSAVWLHPPGAPQKLLRVWQFLLPLDLLWALSPFLLLHHINFGLALACTALLVYAPFAQRSLVLMGAADVGEA
jgi:DNA-binding winged helix-turn-helix (wHTH) protein